MRRARSLDRPDLIPARWSTDFSDLSMDEMPDFMRTWAEFSAETHNLEALFPKESLTAAAGDEEDLEGLTPEEIEAVKVERMNREKDDARPKYTPKTQPRDASGKYRKVLARLKSDLGVAGLNRVIDKVEEAENLDNAGDYGRSAQAAGDLIGIIDRLDAGALNPEALENIRSSSAELGKVIANLPFAFGEQSEKIRFSDVPPALQSLMKDMIARVEEKIGPEDAAEATADLKKFISGRDLYSQSDISSEMATLLRLLT
jgi:hypothetical protein